jgi:hypothetical protein
MSLIGPDPKPPLAGFFLRAEGMAAAAFRQIPVAGDDAAAFFLESVVPYCAPKRDRVLCAVARRLKKLEGGLELILMRVLPLPEPRGPR